MYELNLIFTKDTNLAYLRKLELVFSCLDIPDKNYYTGRPPYPVSAMVNALVFKNLAHLRCGLLITDIFHLFITFRASKRWIYAFLTAL